MTNRNVLGRTRGGFRGLDNVHDPERLTFDWCVQADNIELDDARVVHRRRGYEQLYTGDFTTAFSTRDARRMYVQQGTTLYRFEADFTLRQVATLVSSEPLRADDMNGNLYATNGTDRLVLEADRVRQWGLPLPATPRVEIVPGSLSAGQYMVSCTYLADDGRESGAAPVSVVDVPANSSLLFQDIPQIDGAQTSVYVSTHDGEVLYRVTTTRDTAAQWDGPEAGLAVALRTQGLYPPVPGTAIAAHSHIGRIYVGQHFPEHDVSAIWESEPVSYELFRLGRGFIQVAGEVRLLLGYVGGLVIGTDREVLIQTPDGQLAQVFDYGVPAGVPGALTRRHQPVIWTVRGLAMPGEVGMANQTEKVLDPEFGVEGDSAAVAVMRQDGYERAVVVTEGTS